WRSRVARRSLHRRRRALPRPARGAVLAGCGCARGGACAPELHRDGRHAAGGRRAGGERAGPRRGGAGVHAPASRLQRCLELPVARPGLRQRVGQRSGAEPDAPLLRAGHATPLFERSAARRRRPARRASRPRPLSRAVSASLVVADEANIRRMLARLLESEGYRVSGAADGRAALEAVEAAEPDVVLLDLAMPELDGLATLRVLRERRPELPVVMMSGRASLADAVQATKL